MSSVIDWYCGKCGKYHSPSVPCPWSSPTVQPIPPAPPTYVYAQLSDADIDRIARRIIEILREEAR